MRWVFFKDGRFDRDQPAISAAPAFLSFKKRGTILWYQVNRLKSR
jgi:hypothetical protein